MNKHLKRALLIIADFLSITLAYFLSSLIVSRTESFTGIISGTWYYLLAMMGVMYLAYSLLRLYDCVIRYVGFVEIVKTIIGIFIVIVATVIFSLIPNSFSLQWVITFSLLFIVLNCGARFLMPLVILVKNYFRVKGLKHNKIRVMIIGGGEAGRMLVNEMLSSKELNYDPVCILDDDSNLIGQYANGVKIVGKTLEVVNFAKEYNVEEIYIAMPSVSESVKSKIVAESEKTKCKVMIVPSICQFVEYGATVASAKEVSVQDLLGREQVKVNLDEIMTYIENKVVMVTGGGGSIGSELCRQIAAHSPKQLIIVDIYENNAYDIQQELVRKHPKLNLLVLIASVRDSRRMNSIFATYKPNIVFHAAAHKHVPLMETSPNEAVKNNVSGTLKVAEASGRNGVERFVLISTDKAVNPTNIMGATKRICEMIIQTMNKRYNTNYVAVRFGNVLGSNGSVIPLFKKQIEEGGPVTVTHKDIVRYFMTIPEAVSLVLQAGAYAKGGEIFVLDMGEPVRIYDLAENMIRLSGFEPNKDIEIKITGLRPGEKLYEERLMKEEGLKRTPNKLISIGKPLDIDEGKLFTKIQELYDEAYSETLDMKELVHQLVPTYKIDKR
ncbi:MAG: polysaccharide biosynthesis protein [Clostridia bacterium]|nr:polysaccharide biosynthesis protein [Clostridia bacterium]